MNAKFIGTPPPPPQPEPPRSSRKFWLILIAVSLNIVLLGAVIFWASTKEKAPVQTRSELADGTVVENGCHYNKVGIEGSEVLSHKEDCPNPKHK